jgi:hypothetical protein
LNVHRVSDLRQIEVYTAGPLVPDPSPFEVDTPIANLKRYKSPSSDQIPEDMIQAGGETLRSEIHKLINSTWNKKEFPDQWKKCSFTRKAIKLTVVIIVGYHYIKLHTKLYSISLPQG